MQRLDPQWHLVIKDVEMNKLLKERIKWGTALLAGLTVSFFTADDYCDPIESSSLGLTKKLLLKAEALTSPLFYYFTIEQEPSNGTQTEPQHSDQQALSQTVNPSGQELKI